MWYQGWIRIRIRIEVKYCIRIRSETSVAPKAVAVSTVYVDFKTVCYRVPTYIFILFSALPILGMAFVLVIVLVYVATRPKQLMD